MQQDRFKSWKAIPGGLLLQGEHTEMAVQFSDLAAILEALAKEFPPEEGIVPPPRKPMLPSLKFGQAPE